VSRYQELGLAAACTRKLPKTRAEDEDLKRAVFETLHTPPSHFGINRTSWVMADLKRILTQLGHGASKHTIRQIIRDSGFKWRKARKVLTSKDPTYAKKVAAIGRILANLADNEGFFFVDEYGPFAVKVQGGKKLVAPGTVYTVPQRQKSKGALILTAALDLSRNLVEHFYSQRKNTGEMIKMVELLVSTRRDLRRIYISWDSASWHMSKELGRFIKANNRRRDGRPRVSLAPLPAGAQFLNVIESVFSGMSRAIIHNSDYGSVEETKTAIDRYFRERNEHYETHPKRAGDKIWRMERVECRFSPAHNAKDPRYCR